MKFGEIFENDCIKNDRKRCQLKRVEKMVTTLNLIQKISFSVQCLNKSRIRIKFKVTTNIQQVVHKHMNEKGYNTFKNDIKIPSKDSSLSIYLNTNSNKIRDLFFI